MNTALTAIILGIVLCASIATLMTFSSELKRAYFTGISFWSRWIPVVATGMFLTIIATNIASRNFANTHSLSLAYQFSMIEMTVLFLGGSLLFTKMSGPVAIIALLYCVTNFIFSDALVPNLGLVITTASLTIVAVLGDKLPWLKTNTTLQAGFRMFLFRGLTLGALASIVVAIIKVYSFNRWLGQNLAFTLSSNVVLAILLVMFTGWLCVLLDVGRHFSMAVLTFPSIIVLAYLTGWPGTLLIIPFTISLCLSLAIVDRRQLNRRLASA